MGRTKKNIDTTQLATTVTQDQSTDANKIKVVRTKADDKVERFIGVVRVAKGNQVHTSPLKNSKEAASDWVKTITKCGNVKAHKVVTIKL